MKFLPLFSLIVLMTPAAFAQLLPGIDPNPPQGVPVEALPTMKVAAADDAGTGQILCENLFGIRLETPSDGTLQAIPEGITSGDELRLPSPTTLAVRLQKWIGKPLDQGDLVEIADAILLHYDVEGYPVVAVDVPEQDLVAGFLRFQVQIGRIGNVGVKRPSYGNPKSITAGLRLRRGQLVQRAALDEQLAWYGRTIFRKPQLLVSPGYEPATADLLIALAEKKPWRVSLGYDNNGPELLGKDRFTLGIAGMTPEEHVIGWQTVVGSPISSLQAHAIGWEIPFQKLHQSLQLDAVYAKLLTKSISQGLPVENNGNSWSTAAMQKMFLPSLGRWRQRLAAGVEVKSTNQFLLFGGSQFSPGEVRFADAKVDYSIGRDWNSGACSLSTAMVFSPGNLIPGNDNSDFEAYDPEAKSNYLIWRVSGDGWWSPGADWRIALRGAAQLADARLLPVEQFAAGGFQTVRGLPDREYYADDGWQTSLELYTPAIVFKDICQMRFLAFNDQASVRNRGENANWVSGAGFGMRLSVGDFVDFRLDQGWRLDDHGSQTYFGLQVAF